MGTGKKEKQRRVRENDTRDGNLRVKGENFYRDAKKVQKLNMYKQGRAQRNKAGEVIKAAYLQDTAAPTARVDPNRRWFGNTRVISQDALSHFREALGEKQQDSYQVLLRRNKLPMSLLEEKDTTDSPTNRILETETFEQTFGPKSQRKRPRVAVSSLEDLASTSTQDEQSFQDKNDLASTLGLMGNVDTDGWTAEAKEYIFHKGQSKRIWNELYKVIDSSDVVIHVLDARDPLGTRCESVEQYIKKEAAHKHLIFVLNKCDLVPTWVAVSTFSLFISTNSSSSVMIESFFLLSTASTQSSLSGCLPINFTMFHGDACYNFGRSRGDPPRHFPFWVRVTHFVVLTFA